MGSKTMATPEEQAIQGVIDQIWDTYDVDKSGELDKEETKKFVQDTLGNLGSGDEFSQEAFDEVFGTFDKDNSGTVEKTRWLFSSSNSSEETESFDLSINNVSE